MAILRAFLVGSRTRSSNINIYLTLPARQLSSQSIKVKNAKVAIVGSGPAALYTAQYLLKNINTSTGNPLTIDIYEKLPVPFGLVRYGVAPDHQDVKNVINSFTETIHKPMVNFYGNVSIGSDLKISELMSAYTAVVLAYGSHSENYLNIKGEKEFSNLISARDLVSWYNGLPNQPADRPPVDLKGKKRAVIIGAGNVALDIARILMSPPGKLSQTDISDHAHEILQNSNSIEHVSIVARRGILNAAFTIKELRELSKLDPSVECRFDPKQFDDIKFDSIVNKLSRPRRRITEFMASLAKQSRSGGEGKKIIDFVFLKTPVEILGETPGGPLNGVKFTTNRYDVDFSAHGLKLDNEDALGALAVVHDTSTPPQILPTDLVIRSIGYKNVSIDSDIPFDKKAGVVPNNQGRVLGAQGLYCTGWIKRGPRGVIVDTTSDAFETAQRLCADLGDASDSNKSGSEKILGLLRERKVRVVDKQGWARIDEEEKRRGRETGKPREKFRSIDEMLEIAFSPK